MSEQTPQQTPAATAAYEHLVQTLNDATRDPFAPGAEERLTAAAYAANAAMYPKNTQGN
ncbi:hypothetical protein ACGFYF_41045 [Streptomyces lavendulae]|uniref:hypothetical protein n=1 Tax=Streptomyces lavendulae TaxID=1914 RepID=UPI0037157042